MDAPRTFRYVVCYILAVWIFGFSSFRDYLFKLAVEEHSKPLLCACLSSGDYAEYSRYVSYALFGLGQIFVWSSFLRLGITGTFLGDYCGIFMEKRVTGFPFSVLNNPMYVGSTMCFLATALYKNSLVAFILAAEVYIVYQIALMFEEPYTAMIYREREQNKKTKSK